MKTYMKVVRAIALVGQLGFTLLTPPVVLIALAWWLQSRFHLGTWVMLLALLVGLLTSIASALAFYRRVICGTKKRQKPEGTDRPVVFYKHE